MGAAASSTRPRPPTKPASFRFSLSSSAGSRSLTPGAATLASLPDDVLRVVAGKLPMRNATALATATRDAHRGVQPHLDDARSQLGAIVDFGILVSQTGRRRDHTFAQKEAALRAAFEKARGRMGAAARSLRVRVDSNSRTQPAHVHFGAEFSVQSWPFGFITKRIEFETWPLKRTQTVNVYFHRYGGLIANLRLTLNLRKRMFFLYTRGHEPTVDGQTTPSPIEAIGDTRDALARALEARGFRWRRDMDTGLGAGRATRWPPRGSSADRA